MNKVNQPGHPAPPGHPRQRVGVPRRVGLGFVLSIILLLLFFYVYQRIQIFRMGYRIRNMEKQLLVLEKDNSFLQLKIAGLISPEHISSEVKRLGLDLVPPKEKQIIRVK